MALGGAVIISDYRMVKILTIFWLVSFGFFLEGCGKPPGISTGPDTPKKPSPTFSFVNSDIIVNKCIRCHDRPPVDMTSYNSLMKSGVIVAGNFERSSFFIQISTGRMPKNGPPLSDLEIQSVADWIEEGAPDDEPENGPPAPVPTPNPTPIPTPIPQPPGLQPTFSSITANIFSPKCFRCHSGDKPDGKYDLTTYQGAMADIKPGDAEGSKLYMLVANGKMPKKANPLSADELQTVKDWINSGAPENAGTAPSE